MRVKLRDVAEHAGVSPATASLVLNDKADSIRPETIARVVASAEALGYRPNVVARSLRRNQTHTVAFISDQVVTTPYAGEMILGAQEVATAHDFVLLLANVGSDPASDKSAIDALLDRQVDAVIYATMFHRVLDPPAQLAGLPTVLLNARPEQSPTHAVVPDEYAGASVAVQYLVDAGHRRIGFINDQAEPPAAAERLSAYRDVLERHGLDHGPALVASGASDSDGGRRAAETLLDQSDRPTAVFCFNDRMAAGAYAVARRLGLSIPEDLSIVGFDNQVLVSEAIDPPLTTVQLPHVEMGRWAMERALTLLNEEAEPQLRRMLCPLVERGSVAPPNHP